MKKISIMTVFLILSAAAVMAGEGARDLKIFTRTVFQHSVPAGGSYTPWTINLSTLEGCSSIQLQVSGEGQAEVEYALSNDGQNYAVPEGAEAVFCDVSSSSGEGGDGTVFDSFDVEFGKYMKIGINEIGGASPVTVTATLAVR